MGFEGKQFFGEFSFHTYVFAHILKVISCPLQHPLKDYTFPIRSLTEWFPHEVVRGKREAMAKLIRNLMEQHNPNHSSITLPDIYFSSDDKKDKGGTSTAHTSDASQPQSEVPSQGKPADNRTPEVQLKREQEKVIIKDGVLVQADGSAREQNHRTETSSGNEVVGALQNNDGTACIKVNRVTPSKITPTKSSTVNPSVSKSSSSYTSVKTLPSSSSIITSQVNSVKFQSTAYSQAKSILASRAGDKTIVHESQSPQVNNVRRQVLYTSDDAIFPAKVDQKKVPMRESNSAPLSETHHGTEVSVSNMSGLTLLQSVYSDDDSVPSSKMMGVQYEGSNCLSQVKSGPSVVKGNEKMAMPEMNGAVEQVARKKIQTSVQNVVSVVNGTVHSDPKGNCIMQVSPNKSLPMQPPVRKCVETPQSPHSHSQAKSFSAASQYVSNVNTSNITVQSLNNTKTVFPCTPVSKSHPHSMAPPPQSKKVESVMTGSMGVDKVGNPVKAVESSGQTAIIDEDTAEVLLIMPAKNQSSGQINRTAKKQLENSSPEDDSITIEEGPGLGGYVTSDRRPVKSSLSSGMPKMGAVGGGNERDIRRSVGLFANSPPHSGSSSPTHAGGTGTPAVFKFSERGTSSGRTIAPPKRYLDEEEELYPKKRRDKTVQGKARSIVR